MLVESGLRQIVLTAALAAFLTFPAYAQSPAEFYRGETINIYLGYAPGGSYDFYPRLFTRHFGKYIPGNPNVVIQTMPVPAAFGQRIIFSTSRNGGTSLGVVTQTVMLEEAFGTPGVKYKASEFT